MPFTPIAESDLSAIAQFNQIMSAWEGTGGAGNPMLLTKYEGVEHVVTIQQLDTVYCKMLRVFTYDGTGTQRLELSGPGAATSAAAKKIVVGHNMETLDTVRVDGVDLSAHVHIGGASGLQVRHTDLLALVAPADDHTQYFNAARHTVAEHEPPAMSIDAGTLDGKGPTSFPPWADFKLSKTVQSSAGWNMPEAWDTWGDVGAMSLAIAPAAITDLHVLFTANIEAKAGDWGGNWTFRVSCAKTGGSTTYSEEVVRKATEVAESPMFALSFQGLEPGTYTVKVQFKRFGDLYARQILARRLSVIAFPSTPTVDEPTGDFFISVPSQSYLMGDTVSVTVQYAPNTEVWLMVNGELSSVEEATAHATTSAAGVATLSMKVQAPHFVAGAGSSSGSQNVPMLAVMSVWGGGSTRIAHAYIAVGSGTRTGLTATVGPSSVVATLKNSSTGSGIVGAKVYGWGDEGEVSTTTGTGGVATISVTNCKYVVFKGYISGSVSYAGCVYNIAPLFNAPYTRIPDKPLGIFNRSVAGQYDGGKYYFFDWAAIHTGSSTYDWTSIDAALLAAHNGGYKLAIGIGFYTAQTRTQPYHQVAVPSWLGENRYYLMTSGGSSAYLPKYNNTAFKNAFNAMQTALGARYKGHADLAFVMAGPGIDNESVITKDGGGVKWNSSALYEPHCTANEYETFKAGAYDSLVAAFPGTPVVWHGRRPSARAVYKLAKDGVIFKTNGYTEKGASLLYGASGSEGCLDMLEGLVPCGCEDRYGAGMSGSEYITIVKGEEWEWVTRDLSGHFYTVAAMLMHGNRVLTAHPEYWEPVLLGQAVYQNWFLRALTKSNSWWIILREIPSSVEGYTLTLPSNGQCIQRGPLGYKVYVSGGTRVTRQEWLATNVPKTTAYIGQIGSVVLLRDTLLDCTPVEAVATEEAPETDTNHWNGRFVMMGRKGTVTLHLLGAPNGTYSATLGFYGLGGFTVGGVYVPAVSVAAMQTVSVNDFTLTGGAVTIALGADNYLVFADVWRES